MKKAVMKNIEPAYSFRHELDEVHKRNRRNPALIPRENETSVDESWSIVLPDNADYLVEYAATDLQDYFRVSMNLNLPLRHSAAEHYIVLEDSIASGSRNKMDNGLPEILRHAFVFRDFR